LRAQYRHCRGRYPQSRGHDVSGPLTGHSGGTQRPVCGHQDP
jgi:hypothetical protein